MNQTCRKCNRILPKTDEYFFKSSGNKCKECLGRKFGKRKLINDGVEEGYLRCAKCKEVKEANLTNFYKGRNNKYNLYGECKICCKIRKRKYKEKNREKILKQSREYHQKNKEREKAYSKEYYEKNKETIKKKRPKWWNDYYSRNKEYLLEKRRQIYIENRDHEIAKVKKYQKTEKGRLNLVINVQKRKARLKELPCSYTITDWNEAISYFDERCCYCGEHKKLTKDHFIPLSKGGEFTKNNIIPACGKCNSSKHNNDFYEWYLKQPFYNVKREKKILEYLNIRDNQQQIAFF